MSCDYNGIKGNPMEFDYAHLWSLIDFELPV